MLWEYKGDKSFSFLVEILIFAAFACLASTRAEAGMFIRNIRVATYIYDIS